MLRFFCMGSQLLGGKNNLAVPFDGMGVKAHARGNSGGSPPAHMLPFTGITLPCIIPGPYGPSGFPGAPGFPGME